MYAEKYNSRDVRKRIIRQKWNEWIGVRMIFVVEELSTLQGGYFRSETKFFF